MNKCAGALCRVIVYLCFFIAVRLAIGVIIIFCIKIQNVFISVFGFERHAVLFRFEICISRLHTPGAYFVSHSEVANICKALCTFARNVAGSVGILN